MAASSSPLARKRASVKKPAKSRVREEAKALYRKAILDAAEAVFAEKGMYVARVQDIAARAGLSVGAIYNYFEQKEDVLVALLMERIVDLVAMFAKQPDDPSDFAEQLVARTKRFLVYVDQHRAFFDVASDHGLLGPNGTSAQNLLAGKPLRHKELFEKASRELMNEGVAQGFLVDLPLPLLVLHFRHTLKSASLYRRDQPEVSIEDAAKLAIDLFLSGAGAARDKKKR